jgi:hypothetical protein
MSDAVVVGLFTLAGVTLSSGLTWVAAFLQHRRAGDEFNRRQSRDDRVRLADMRREAVVGVAHSWAKVVQADAARIEAGRVGAGDPGLSPTVEPLTELGLNLNKLLVLPISPDLEDRVFQVDTVVGRFRASYRDIPARTRSREEAGRAIIDLIKAARDEGTV